MCRLESLPSNLNKGSVNNIPRLYSPIQVHSIKPYRTDIFVSSKVQLSMGTARLLFSLLSVMGVTGQQRIIYVPQSFNWTDAQAHCRLHHNDLVTITTEAENVQINQDSWLGLYRENSSSDWKWSKGDEPHTFDNEWVKGNPDQGEDCVYKQAGDNGLWRSKRCDETRKFFCLDRSLFLVRQLKTWQEALVHCRSLSSGNHTYDLASLITAEDQEFVRSQISDKVWIGLRFLGDRWVWIGGEEVQYDDINSCPMRERCGTVDKASAAPYNIARCEEQRDFLCYRKL